MKIYRSRVIKYARLLTVLLVLGGLLGGVLTRYLFQESALMIWSRYVSREIAGQGKNIPALGWLVSMLELLIVPDRAEAFEVVNTATSRNTPRGWTSTLVGYSPERYSAPVTYDPQGKPQGQPRSTVPRVPLVNPSAVIDVATASAVRRAIRQAIPGQVIRLLPGQYSFTEKSIPLWQSGTPAQPITITAAQPGTAILDFNIPNGFFVQAPYWVIQNLVIRGNCPSDSACEHAFHVVGKAHSTVIRNNWVADFNAPVKVNSSKGNAPDAGLLEYNTFLATRPRQTSNPVDFLDFVATDNWRVRKNIIADFAKQQGNQVSYGAFFKGAGQYNIFEQNLVMCEWAHRGGTRIGFSFGGGGTGAQYCRDGKCEFEQQNSIARNNIIMNCPRDVGIYVNKSNHSLINNNLLYNTRGIDVRFPQSQATILNNVIDGRILSRNGGRYTARANLTSALPLVRLNRVSDMLFADPAKGDFRLLDETKIIAKGVHLQDPGADFCGRAHDPQHPDIGPFNYQAGMSLDADKRPACSPLIPLSVPTSAR